MAAGEIHRGDIGTTFVVTIKDENGSVVDVSGATTTKINFKAPNVASVLGKTASLYTDGTDGKIKYVSQSGDLYCAGMWLLQGFITTPSGSWSSDIVSFKIFPNLGDA